MITDPQQIAAIQARAEQAEAKLASAQQERDEYREGYRDMVQACWDVAGERDKLKAQLAASEAECRRLRAALEQADKHLSDECDDPDCHCSGSVGQEQP